MSGDNFMRANEVDVNVTGESDLPEGWEQTHEEGRRRIRDGMGYYIHQCQSGGGATSEIFDVLEAAGVQYDKRELGPANVGYYKGRPCIIDWASLF